MDQRLRLRDQILALGGWPSSAPAAAARPAWWSTLGARAVGVLLLALGGDRLVHDRDPPLKRAIALIGGGDSATSVTCASRRDQIEASVRARAASLARRWPPNRSISHEASKPVWKVVKCSPARPSAEAPNHRPDCQDWSMPRAENSS
jgi:hypothetical protein